MLEHCSNAHIMHCQVVGVDKRVCGGEGGCMSIWLTVLMGMLFSYFVTGLLLCI